MSIENKTVGRFTAILASVQCLLASIAVAATVLPSMAAHAAEPASREALVCRLGDPESLIARQAVAELAWHLEKFCGVKCRVVEGQADRPAGQLRFLVGEGPAGAAPVGDHGRFAISIRGDDVWLWGHDMEVPHHTEAFDIRYSVKGSMQAVYQFLREFAGMRWLMPGDAHIVRTDALAPLTLPETFDKTYQWRFPNLRVWAFGMWPQRNMARSYDGWGWSYTHNWAHLIGYDSLFKEHPEYYALVGGQRRPFRTTKHVFGLQVCTSAPAVADIFAAKLVADYRVGDPGSGRPPGNNPQPLSPNDGQGFCECDACRSLDRPQLYTPAETADLLGNPCVSDRVFTFANTVARKVAKEEPGLRVGVFLYDNYVIPPKSVERLEPNIFGQFCVDPGQFNDAAYKEKTLARMGEWLAKGLGGMDFFWYTGTHYWGQVLTVHPHAIGEFIKQLAAEPAVNGVYTEVVGADAAANALNYYVFFTLMNDPEADVDAVIDEFCRLGFGPAADPMRDYFALAEKTFMERDSAAWGMDCEVVRWYDDAFFEQAGRLLDTATAAVADHDAVYATRVGLMRAALDLTRDKVELVSALAGLKKSGLPITLAGLVGPYDPPVTPKKGDRATRDALIDRAIAARRRMFDTARRYQGTDWFSARTLLRTDGDSRWPKTFAYLEALRGAKEILPLEGDCFFRTDPDNAGLKAGWQEVPLPAEGWRPIKLDTSWEDQGFGNPQPDGYDGIGWYRIPVQLGNRHRQATFQLHLGAVGGSCEVWVNGVSVGTAPADDSSQPPLTDQLPVYYMHERDMTPRVFDITSAIRLGGPNMIAIRVDNDSGRGGVWKGAYLTARDSSPGGR